MKLIEILYDAGFEWPEGDWNYVAQDGNGEVFPFRDAPRLKNTVWITRSLSGSNYAGLFALAPDWSTAVITREQYEAYCKERKERKDGWIPWGGGDCPVERGTLVDVQYGDVKYADGDICIGVSAMTEAGDEDHVRGDKPYYANDWQLRGAAAITAYRIHKPEQEQNKMKDYKEENANIKSPAELATRLENGEVFYDNDGDRLWYDASESNPFRIGNTAVYHSWSNFAKFKIRKPLEWWEEEGALPALCVVSDAKATPGLKPPRICIITHVNKTSEFGFLDTNAVSWRYARLATADEIGQYIKA